MKNETSQGSVVISVIQSESVADLAKEYLEMGIDALLESSTIKEIPIVNTFVAMFRVTGSVREKILANKIIRFLTQLSELPKDKRIALAERLSEDEKFAGRAGAAVIEIIDRMESEKKPELAAKFFAAYAKNEVSFEELRRLLLALERIPSFDIDKLGQFSKASLEESLKMDEGILLGFVNAGLGQHNGGLSGGAILPTRLCKKFVNVGLCS